MAYVKTYLPTLKTHVVNLKRDAKDLSRDSQRLEVRGKLGSKIDSIVVSPSQDAGGHTLSRQNKMTFGVGLHEVFMMPSSPYYAGSTVGFSIFFF